MTTEECEKKKEGETGGLRFDEYLERNNILMKKDLALVHGSSGVIDSSTVFFVRPDVSRSFISVQTISRCRGRHFICCS